MNQMIKFFKSIRWIYVIAFGILINFAIMFDCKQNILLYIFANLVVFVIMPIYLYIDGIQKQQSNLKRKLFFENITNDELLNICKERNNLDFLYKIMLNFNPNYSKELFENEILDLRFGDVSKFGLPFYKIYLMEIGYF